MENQSNATPEFLADNSDLIDALALIAGADHVAHDLLSDIHGYGSITPKQIRLGWYRVNRAKKETTP